MKASIITAVFLFSLISLSAQRVENPSFDDLLQRQLKHDVPEITVKELQTETEYILLDARDPVEFNTSHIQGALYVNYPPDFELRSVRGLDKNANIVVYCSVGLRSENVVRTMIESGYTNVKSLYGGIFEWSNQELPLVNNKGKTTTKVHGVDDEWKVWITKGDVVIEK
jgi:rhodanese-related sulfurtransferase